MTRKAKAAPAQEPVTFPIPDVPNVPSIFDQYETDTVEQEDGRWFRSIGLGIDMKLRRYTSRQAQNQMQRLQMAYRTKADQKGQLPPEIVDKLMTEFLATAVIVDWEGDAFRMRDGTPLPYSVETAKMLLDKLPELRNDVIMISTNIENYRVRDRAEIEGN